jgi:hypothetical protein
VNDFLDRARDAAEVAAGEGGMDGQGNDVFRQARADREVAVVAEPAKDRLAMQRQRIMHRGLDAAAQKSALELVPAHSERLGIEDYRVQAEGVVHSTARLRSLDSGKALEPLRQDAGVCAAAAKSVAELAQLGATDGRGDIRQAEVVAEKDVPVTPDLAVRAEQAQLLRKLATGCGDHAAFARGHVLGGIERIAGHVGK